MIFSLFAFSRAGLAMRAAGAALATAVLTVAVLAAPGPSQANVPRSAAARGPVVDAPSGRYRGLDSSAMDAFLGIPYAQPPVGPLRWQPPQPLPPTPSSPSPIDATSFGPHCPQNGGAFGQGSTSEDCLYLNVFSPDQRHGGGWSNGRPPRHGGDDGRGLPVMVWIHGGAFTTGESDAYNPDRLVPHGVVVVTLNYRLGLLGFFAQSALDAEGHKVADYGLMDQQAALQWVHRNIGAFGGDPRRVTIFGESAGGLSVFSQLSSPGAAGLFSAAIDESGSYQLTLPTLAQSEAAGNATATALGCSTAACLRAVPVSTLLATEGGMTVPTVDGTVLPQSPAAAFASGKFNRVPIVDGTNHDEYRLFVGAEFDLTPGVGPITAAEYEPLIAASLGPAGAAAVVAQYPLANYPSPDLAFATVVTDFIFSCPALGADESLFKYVPVFAYEFADENAPEPFLPPVSFPYGSAHASELQFLWDNFAGPNPPLTLGEQRLASDMTGYWTTFAIAHQPNSSPDRLWLPFIGPFANMQSLVPPKPSTTLGFAADHKCAFWAQLEMQAGSPATPSLQRVHDASLKFRGLRR